MSTNYGSDPVEPHQADRLGPIGDQASVTSSNIGERADPRSRVAAEKAQYGGVKLGSAFFGWLTATGVAVLLTASVAAAGIAVAVAAKTDVATATTRAATQSPNTVGVVGTIVLLVILFIAYYCGGYVAGRMARFNGAQQGAAVWMWALLVAVVAAIGGTVGGSKYNVLAQLNSFPRIPVKEGTLTTAGIIALIAVGLVSLGGAILGGLAGMRFHRRVDSAGLGV